MPADDDTLVRALVAEQEAEWLFNFADQLLRAMLDDPRSVDVAIEIIEAFEAALAKPKQPAVLPDPPDPPLPLGTPAEPGRIPERVRARASKLWSERMASDLAIYRKTIFRN